KDKKRIVIKIGSSSLTHAETGDLNLAKIEKLVRIISDMRGMGKEVILVSSGAIATGRQTLGGKKPETVAEKQAYAAVGQARLMMTYQKIFAEYNQVTAQILMTRQTISNDTNRINAQNTFEELFRMGVIPIVNENDTVATHEIEIGDNDTLSAIVASMIGADLLILLSDIDGLYTDDPRANPDAEFIETVEHLDESFLRMGKSTTGSGVGTGGMSTKLTAATIATASGADMVIANSKDVRIIHRIIDGENYGTLFLAEKQDAFDLPDFVENLHSCRERG
ncbi:MAG: glutamate 5-kinase, partial [Lachnospiraceae bacterium]|nr:glutamate 5-kinase [Lachnospiraceae bacterium]